MVADSDRTEIDGLRAELASLRQEVRALRAQLQPPAPERPTSGVPRRQLLRAAGAAAVGSVVATVAGSPVPATAATGDGMILGQLNQAGTTTELDAGASQFGLYVRTSDPGFAAAVRGRASAESGDSQGVRGVSDSPDGQGVFGLVTTPTGANAGVHGSTESRQGTGVLGSSTNTKGVSYGVRGTVASPRGYGVCSEGNALVDGRLEVTGRRVHLRLVPRPNRPANGDAGDLVVDGQQRLWFCKGGSTWVQLA